MNLSQEQILAIKQELNIGNSSRSIAKKLGISKSVVNNYRHKQVDVKLPKVTFIDVETGPDIAVTFKRFKANFNQDNILQEGGWLLSVAYAFDDGIVHSACLTPDEALAADDSRLVALMWEVIENSRVICGHHINGFDLPVIKARCAIHGFPALRKIKTIDTLQQAKQMRFQSNRLGSLGVALGEGDKLGHEGIDLWVKCLKGDPEALEHMRLYNEQDVELQRKVYKRLRSFDSKHPNLSITDGNNEHQCPVCGSHDVEPSGNCITTNLSVFEEYVCNDCSTRSRGRKAINSSEHRASQLVA